MSRIPRLPAVLLLVALCGPLQGPTLAGAPVIDSVKRLIVSQRYREADALLDSLSGSAPADIHILSQRLTNRQTEILEYESYVIHGRAFIAFADSVIDVLEHRLEGLSGRDSLDCLFYLATAHGGRGVMLAKVGNWLSAVRAALKSRAMLESVVEVDSTYFAAFLGLGAFDYYLSQGLRWLPLYNRTDEGIAAIEQAACARFPYDIAAKNVLCWIYMERNRYAAADSVCQSVLAEFPDNSVFVKIGTCNALWTQRWEETTRRATKLIGLARSRTPVNWCDLLTGYRSLVDACMGMGDTVRALDAAREAIECEVPRQYLKIRYVKEHLERIQDVVEEYGEEQ